VRTDVRISRLARLGGGKSLLGVLVVAVVVDEVKDGVFSFEHWE
jgi:hypothetical protein